MPEFQEFEQRVEAGLPGDVAHQRVLVGVSGGADSVALLTALIRLAERLPCDVIAAHLNHGLRGADSDADAEWVAALCRELDVPLDSHKVDVAAIASEQGRTIEEAARNARYEFFIASARKHDCRFVAVAHTADDQVETILHHIIRGTGLAGLRGMPARRELADGVELIRPLLAVSRCDVEAWLAAIGRSFRQDATNVDESFTRNRIRHSLLPVLREQFNPRVNDALLRLAGSAADAEDALRSIARELLDAALLECTPEVCRLQCDALRSAPRHLLRVLFTELWKRTHWPRRQMGFDDWDRLAELLDDPSAITLPGNIDARRRGELLVLTRG